MNPVERSLLDCLNNEIAAMIEFQAALKTEARALTEPSTLQELEAVGETKNRLATRLTELDTQRETLFKQLGPGEGWEAAVQAMSGTPELAQAWARLQEISREAQTLNNHNGTLLEVHLRHTQKSLNALNAETALGNTYDAQGRVQSPGSGKRISAG